MGLTALLLRRKALRIFIALKNPSLSDGIEPANIGSNGKHASHYNTEDDKMIKHSVII
jgi:hypothetical protein